MKSNKGLLIGGGILGLAIGYELSISHPNFKVSIFEKDDGKFIGCKKIEIKGYCYIKNI